MGWGPACGWSGTLQADIVFVCVKWHCYVTSTLPGVRSALHFHLQGAPRLLFMRAFAHLFEGKPSGLNTLNILRSMSHLTSLRAAINQIIIDDFTAAREAVRVRGNVSLPVLMTCTMEGDKACKH